MAFYTTAPATVPHLMAMPTCSSGLRNLASDDLTSVSGTCWHSSATEEHSQGRKGSANYLTPHGMTAQGLQHGARPAELPFKQMARPEQLLRLRCHAQVNLLTSALWESALLCCSP